MINKTTLMLVILLVVTFAFGCGSVELPDEELTVTGIVTNPDGGRVGGATVVVVNTTTSKQAAIGRTDASGRFAIQLGPGNYTAYSRGEQTENRVTQRLEGMTEPFAVTEDGLTPRMQIQLYNIVQVRTLCELSEEEIDEHADKKELIALFSTQKFRELGIKEGQVLKITNLSTRHDIVVYGFPSDDILCELSLPPVVVQKLTSPFRPVEREEGVIISVSLEISIAQPELFR